MIGMTYEEPTIELIIMEDSDIVVTSQGGTCDCDAAGTGQAGFSTPIIPFF